jgi:hypothetical protein
MKFYLVDIKDINSDLPRSHFNLTDIDDLAEAILASDGLIHPLVLKQQGIDKYSVVEGHLEYYAAVRAKEKNARQAEMVNAFVIPAKIEDAVKKQAQLFNHSRDRRDSRGKSTSPNSISEANIPSGNDTRITNLELRLEQRFNEIQSSLNDQIRQVNDRVTELESKSSKPENPLELFNSLTEPQLAIKLQRSRIHGAEKLAKNIVTARHQQPHQQFSDYRSIVDSVKGLGEKTLLTTIDAWSRS